ncbi:hypothetical protein A2U01_0004456 [Trifolium medium]|uniref:Uncharacterized protein n=1 Tax=Trifolium medium TaxID=97028 RepID=A0A392M827_9FABA|nr:hypothetical protein [Trifolium medium]
MIVEQSKVLAWKWLHSKVSFLVAQWYQSSRAKIWLVIGSTGFFCQLRLHLACYSVDRILLFRLGVGLVSSLYGCYRGCCNNQVHSHSQLAGGLLVLVIRFGRRRVQGDIQCVLCIGVTGRDPELRSQAANCESLCCHKSACTGVIRITVPFC